MHAIAFGTRLFGKVDSVRGHCHVATVCWHFCYVPLVPLGTYLVFSVQQKGLSGAFAGIRIAFSWKSWLVAWGRLILGFPIVLGGLAAFGLTIAAIDGQKQINWDVVLTVYLGLLAVAGIWGGSYLAPGVGRATAKRRAVLMAVQATVPPTDLVNTNTRSIG